MFHCSFFLCSSVSQPISRLRLFERFELRNSTFSSLLNLIFIDVKCINQFESGFCTYSKFVWEVVWARPPHELRSRHTAIIVSRQRLSALINCNVISHNYQCDTRDVRRYTRPFSCRWPHFGAFFASFIGVGRWIRFWHDTGHLCVLKLHCSSGGEIFSLFCCVYAGMNSI